VVVISLCGCRQQTQTTLTLPPTKVTVAKPVEQEVLNYAEFTGNTAAVNSVDIRARVTGYLDKVAFEEGALVKSGDLLFVIDPRQYQAAFDQAQANVEQSQAELALAESNFERAERLRQTNVIDVQSYQTQVANRDQAKATLLASQAALETAQLNLGFTEIRSPIDGRTSISNYTVGNLIAAGDTSSTGVLTSVVSVDPVYVYVNVDERGMLAYQEMVRSGQIPYSEGGQTPIEMQLANETDYPHKGIVDFVDNQVDPSTGTIRVRGSFPNKDGLLRPGLFARVRIPAGPKHKALLISDLSIGYDQGEPIVYVVGADNIATAKPVKLGAISSGLRVVEEGVNSIDRIVVNGIVRLRPGIPVAPEEGNMTDFSGTVRRQIAVAPGEGNSKQSNPVASTPGSHGSISPATETQH
jgi:RND family efflux transporter MFP subunit